MTNKFYTPEQVADCVHFKDAMDQCGEAMAELTNEERLYGYELDRSGYERPVEPKERDQFWAIFAWLDDRGNLSERLFDGKMPEYTGYDAHQEMVRDTMIGLPAEMGETIWQMIETKRISDEIERAARAQEYKVWTEKRGNDCPF